MKKIRLTEKDLQRIVKKVINESMFDMEKDNLITTLMRRLKGISREQLMYNLENDLPWDWRGSKEGFYERMEPKKYYGGGD